MGNSAYTYHHMCIHTCIYIHTYTHTPHSVQQNLCINISHIMSCLQITILYGPTYIHVHTRTSIYCTYTHTFKIHTQFILNFSHTMSCLYKAIIYTLCGSTHTIQLYRKGCAHTIYMIYYISTCMHIQTTGCDLSCTRCCEQPTITCILVINNI